MTTSNLKPIFQLTSSQGGWPARACQIICEGLFQLTSSQGGWRKSRKVLLKLKNFNSHPRKEDDQSKMELLNAYNISTHILARRMTQCERCEEKRHDISTHILARRMTMRAEGRCRKMMISTHILARRMTLMGIPMPPQITFQLTSSQGGWRFFHLTISCSRSISTHILARRMTKTLELCSTQWTFQLTSSQGGWHLMTAQNKKYSAFQLTSSQGGWHYFCYWSYCISNISTHILARRMTREMTQHFCFLHYFNSHPRKEDDTSKDNVDNFGVISTHILARRMTLLPAVPRWCHLHFNSHPRKEDDWIVFVNLEALWHFNSHPRKEDDLAVHCELEE